MPFTDYYPRPDLYQANYGQSVSAFPQGPLDLRADINLGTWQDATPFIYQRTPVTFTRGRANQSSTLASAPSTMVLNNRDGRWTVRNPAGAWYGKIAQSTQFRLSVPSSLAGISCYLRLETDNQSYAQTPDVAALQITSGTLSVRVDCKITDWRQANLIGKYGPTLPLQAWALQILTGGGVTLFHVDGGGNAHSAVSSLPLPYFNARIAVRADYNITAKTITFFTAPTMAGSWTQLGTVQNTPATTLAAAAGQPVTVGGAPGSASPGMFGEVYEAQILATGVLKADPVFTTQTPGFTSFTDAQSNTWTTVGSAELSGRLYRFAGELTSLPKTADPTGTDVYSTATASGITQRMQQGQSPADSAMKRTYAHLPASLRLAAYWPAEDPAGSTQIGSASVAPPMPMSTAVKLAQSTVFACSAPLPAMNGGTLTGALPGTGIIWQDNAVRFLLAVPAGDDTNNAVVCQYQTQGTVATVRVVYTTGGNLQISGYSAAGVQLFTGGGPYGLLGNPVRVSAQLVNAGGGNITWALTTVAPGATTGTTTTASIAGTIGAVTSVSFGGGLVGSAMGHFSVQAVADNPVGLNVPLNAWNGETAGTRFARLCGEEGIACRIVGPPDRSFPMGNQTQQTIFQLLQECETTDQGLMFEPRQVPGLGYVTNWALCQQPVAATADYSLATIAGTGFAPTTDNQLLVNDVTMTSADGSTSRQILTTGAMSILAPPAGSGRINTNVSVNPQSDASLSSLANNYLNVRSVNEDRYPTIPFDMARTETPAAVALLDIGSYVQLINTPAWVPPGPVKQLCAGIVETLGPFGIWTVGVNGIPETPYETGIVSDLVYGHADTDGSVLHAAINSTSTAVPVDTLSGFQLWTTAGGDLPFDVTMGGEQMTVTAITGTSSPQTFTVTRSVNGVVKAHAAGEDIRLTHPMLVTLGV